MNTHSGSCALVWSLVLLVLGVPCVEAQDSRPLLTMERVVSMYIERNLELQAARFRLERTKADQIAATLRPNPVVTVTGENFRLSGPVSFGRLYELAGTYSETIELGGKRPARERV